MPPDTFSDIADNQPLVFVGRLSRQEVISFAMNRLLRNWAKRYAYLVFVVAVAILTLLHVSRPVLQWRFAELAIPLAAGFLAGLLILTGRIFLTAKEQEHDSTLTLNKESVTVSNRGYTTTIPIASLELDTLRDGFAAYCRGGPFFMLPFRVMSPSQRTQIERIFAASRS